jgi:hypothetical protein
MLLIDVDARSCPPSRFPMHRPRACRAADVKELAWTKRFDHLRAFSKARFGHLIGECLRLVVFGNGLQPAPRLSNLKQLNQIQKCRDSAPNSIVGGSDRCSALGWIQSFSRDCKERSHRNRPATMYIVSADLSSSQDANRWWNGSEVARNFFAR